MRDRDRDRDSYYPRPTELSWRGRDFRSWRNSRIAARLSFFSRRAFVTRGIIGWPCKGTIAEEGRKNSRGRGISAGESYRAKFACACLSGRHLVSYCAAVALYAPCNVRKPLEANRQSGLPTCLMENKTPLSVRETDALRKYGTQHCCVDLDTDRVLWLFDTRREYRFIRQRESHLFAYRFKFRFSGSSSNTLRWNPFGLPNASCRWTIDISVLS